MAAIDSLLGIVDLQKADGLVLVQGKTPTLLGGKGGGALTMPPLDAGMMDLLLQELLTPDDVRRLSEGAVIERPLGTDPTRPFTVTARLDSGRTKIVVRRGGMREGRPPAISADPIAARPPASIEAPPLAPAPEPGDDVIAIETPGAPSGAPALTPTVLRALDAGLARRVSDVILSAGQEPLAKRAGRLEALGGPAVTAADVSSLLVACANPEARRAFEQSGSADFALAHGPRRTRLRVNVFRQLGGLAAVLRPIWDEVPTLGVLGLPSALLRTIALPNGLVLMAGATGSGKSTTLAALVEHLAETRGCHIVTLEDPIEYVFGRRMAIVHQREVGTHVASFAAGLRAALRESPDVILVGEMRDAETISLALIAAETGHLVLSTLHAGTAAGAIERLVSATPEGQRSAIRAQVASALRFVLTQQLLPATDGGRVPAVEVLAVNHAVAAQIRDGRTQLLNTQIELGGDEGMVTMEQSLLELVRAGRISRQVALAATAKRDELERLLGEVRPGPRRPAP
jgi:twitching motility protein PilT